jgi:hypothetical protein
MPFIGFKNQEDVEIDWKPMSEAPLDGTKVILRLNYGMITTGYYSLAHGWVYYTSYTYYYADASCFAGWTSMKDKEKAKKLNCFRFDE